MKTILNKPQTEDKMSKDLTVATEKPKKLGRPKGAVAKTPTTIKYVAQRYGSECIEALARIVKNSSNEQNKIAAAREILDRGYGKATQMIGSDADQPVELVISWARNPTPSEQPTIVSSEIIE